MTTKPTIHMNGTSRAALAEMYQDAYSAVDEALTKLCMSSPNARDYYVKPGSYELAVAEHEARVDKLRSVMRELRDLVESTFE